MTHPQTPAPWIQPDGTAGAALAAGVVAVTGVVATIVFLVWVSTTGSTNP
ncbi:hypothetical protein AB0B48_15310 [Micromonospora sp. NPDC049089]